MRGLAILQRFYDTEEAPHPTRSQHASRTGRGHAASNLHKLLGHSRQILQMDVGGMPHEAFLRSIELLGQEVLPGIRKELER